ncbi:MAG: NAD-dependent epimerase/dehydratase family protein [Rubrivivax sp.]
MKLLIIGGTRFAGWHTAAAALARGHTVDVFHRGRSGAPPDGARELIGDRNGDLSALGTASGGDRWDAVLDTCGYRPAEITRVAEVLAGRIERYAFVSSISVYTDASVPVHEDSPLGVIDDPDTDVVDGRSYGPLKALCEAEAVRRFGAERTLIVRPGLIVGPRDPTQRFTYWPARLARVADEGEAASPVLAPGSPAAPLQWIDARDLADFIVGALEQGRAGAFNAVGAPGRHHFGALLQACAEAAGLRTPPPLRWVDIGTLQGSHGLQPWSDLPLALPDDDEHRAFMAVDAAKARAAGLRERPLAETLADTLAWWRSLPPEQQLFDKAGLTPEREQAVLAALDRPIAASGLGAAPGRG